MSLKDALLGDFEQETRRTREILELLRGLDPGWQPHARARTLWSLAVHLGDLTALWRTFLDGAAFDLSDAPASPCRTIDTPDRLLAKFDAECASAAVRLRIVTDAELLAPWALRREGRPLFTVPRLAAVRSFLLNHLLHHRGQLCVYLQMLDVPLPAWHRQLGGPASIEVADAPTGAGTAGADAPPAISGIAVAASGS